MEPFSNQESKEEELDLSLSSSQSDTNGIHGRPPLSKVLRLLRSFTHEQLIDLLAPHIDETTYAKLLKEAESDVNRRKLFVHGLPAKATESQLWAFFEQYGTVEVVELPHAKPHSDVKYGFVVFQTVEALHVALEQPNKIFEGKEICCKLFTVRSSSLGDCSPATAPLAGLQAGRKLFVSGLAPMVTDKDLLEHFRRCGDIEVAQVNYGKSTGQVTFCEASSAREALLSLNKSVMFGRQILVAWFRKQEDMRRNSFTQALRPPPAPYASPNQSSAAFATSTWYNYNPYVQQDPYLLVPMTVYQPEFQLDGMMHVRDDKDLLGTLH